MGTTGTAVAGDFDADGRGDVLVYPSTLYRSRGDRTFDRITLGLGAQYRPTSVDQDRDGDTDLVVTSASGKDLLLRSKRDGTFTYAAVSIPDGYDLLVPGDFDGTMRARRGAPFPAITDREIVSLLFAIQPQPNTSLVTTPPSITGDAAADARIRSIAERRGYRRRSVATGGLTSSQGVPLQPTAANALAGMRSAAANAGHSIRAQSGYRSISDQRSIFLRHLREQGSFSNAQIASGQADRAIDHVLQLHSIPGYSRHHSGYAMDLSSGSDRVRANTATEVWLRGNRFAHAMAYGFLPSYPPGGGNQGPVPEAWEYTYVSTHTIRCAGWYLDLADPAARWSCPDGP
jgi:hypothetical protein